ncbi:MAG: OmpA family protein [Sulfuricurvum sp.]|nr:OmpA family protein [Sulfuricurvum sp.]
MQKHNLHSRQPGFILCLLTLGISISGYALDPSCPIGHEICPEHLVPTQYTTGYDEMINHQVVATTYAAPKVVPPVVVAKAVPETDTDKDGVVDSKDECPDTPLGYKVNPVGCPISVTLHVNFPHNSSVIPASNESDIIDLVKILHDNPPAKVAIIGHTDDVGSDKYNQTLSEKRSKAMGDKLIANGISADRITTTGMGEKQPIATNKTAQGRAQNRRIQVNLK